MAKRHKSVPDLVRNLTDDKEFQEALQEELAKGALAKALFTLRCREGVTQKEMAERLNCTQSRISKIEHSDVGKLRVGDLIAYARALNLQLSIGFQKEMTSVESVKFHAFEIKRHLDHLATLAKRDDQILEGVSNFYAEALMNILRFFKQSASLLPETKRRSRPIVEISTPSELPDEEMELAAR